MPNPDYDEFKTAIKATCAEMVLQPTDSFLQKIIQTYEMMIVRHGYVGTLFSGCYNYKLHLKLSLSCMAQKGNNWNIYKKTDHIMFVLSLCIRRFMLVGGPIAGKTCVLKALAGAMTSLAQKYPVVKGEDDPPYRGVRFVNVFTI